MDAFKLDRLVTIEQRADTRNALGEVTVAWSTFARVWSKRVALRGAELYATNQMVAEAECKYRIRWRTGITESMRLNDHGTVYGIKHIADPVELGAKVSRRQWLDLTVGVFS